MKVTLSMARSAVYRHGDRLRRALFIEDRGADYPYRYALMEVVKGRDGGLATIYADGSGTGLYEKSPRDVLAMLALGRVVDNPPLWSGGFINYDDLYHSEHWLSSIARDAMTSFRRDDE